MGEFHYRPIGRLGDWVGGGHARFQMDFADVREDWENDAIGTVPVELDGRFYDGEYELYIMGFRSGGGGTVEVYGDSSQKRRTPAAHRSGAKLHAPMGS